MTTATFTATQDSETPGSVAVTAFTDVAGNAGTGDSDSVTIDTRNPTVTVDIVAASLNDGDDNSQVTFTFSEAVNPASVVLDVQGGSLPETFPYRFDFQMAPRNVTVTLFYSRITQTAWVFVRDVG